MSENDEIIKKYVEKNAKRHGITYEQALELAIVKEYIKYIETEGAGKSPTGGEMNDIS